MGIQYKFTNVFVFFNKQKNLEKKYVEAFLVTFPKGQDNFVFSFVTQSALTNHSTMTIGYFNYQAKKRHSCFANFKDKEKKGNSL